MDGCVALHRNSQCRLQSGMIAVAVLSEKDVLADTLSWPWVCVTRSDEERMLMWALGECQRCPKLVEDTNMRVETVVDTG